MAVTIVHHHSAEQSLHASTLHPLQDVLLILLSLCERCLGLCGERFGSKYVYTHTNQR